MGLAAAILGSACASSGAVPRPFPMPARAGTPQPGPETASTSLPASREPDWYGLVGTALDLRGIRYRDGGTDPQGFDCSGFTQYVFARHGVALPRAVREQYRIGEPVRDDLAPGDLLFFTTAEPGASHVAILVGGDEFVHAPSSTGVVRVEHLSASYWAQRFLGARRVTPP
jgi:cell wall-associated NlpC family hydrolase